MYWALDAAVILRMRHCDVFICMSGMYLQALRYARWRYGARVVLHRGSMHILAQKEVLNSVPGKQKVTSFAVHRELKGYCRADRIAIPSGHVAESFRPWPKYARKLFVNRYGVDLQQFPLRKAPPPVDRVVLFVGNWSYQKGVDILTEAIKGMDDVKLIHVGPLVDAPFPNQFQFVHYGPVPQWELKRFYGAAHVFCLPSRQDGFGVVLCQALATGLPIVCSDRTGGADLASLPEVSRLIHVVPAGNPVALRFALAKALDDVTSNAVPSITEVERDVLGWRQYAVRELRFIEELLSLQSSWEKEGGGLGATRCE
jgi:glycosyltransferase involved in cell wall biosynthesis